MKRQPPLREGFTTGTAAAGAAKAAARLLLSGERLAAVDTPLPGGARLALPVVELTLHQDTARAVVIKDGGDDPDATHGARIGCRVTCRPDEAGRLTVEGGQGVGRVTLPGLPVPVGQPAINPAPLAQIKAALAEAAAAAGYAGGLVAVVEVADGEAIAQKTLNPRLGIVGGISILGVSGIVRPFSHQAFRASIAEGLDVARALGHDTVGLASGRRSEALLARHCPELPETARIEAADFFAFSLKQAAKRGFSRILWATFGGKLVKMAQGLANTHAHQGATDFSVLAAGCREAGWPETACRAVARANTARHAFELAPTPAAKAALAELLARQALGVMTRFAGPGPALELCVFDFDGSRLVRVARPSAPEGST